jgi:hypothetical protein
VSLSREEEAFRGRLNREMLSICEQLPQSMQTGAAKFLLEYLQAFNNGFHFVNYFYAPAWTILFWLHRSCPDNRKLNLKYMGHAKTAHTMAMFLHAFDDHLTDGQLPVTHLALLMRSQSWIIMNRAFERLARGEEKAEAIVNEFIDDYCSSIETSEEAESLDCYCALFRKQMATWLIVPILLARRICADEEFAHSVQAAYSSFGIAWRLLDDVQDIKHDMIEGVHSSIYVCLNENIRSYWDKDPEEKKDQNTECVQTILRYILEEKVINIILDRACNELDSAASIADSCSMPGLASEFRCLMKPLKNWKNRS